MSNPARPADMPIAHAVLVAQVRAAKADLNGLLEGGHRDWPAVRAALAKYIDLQTAADVVSGQTPILR